MKKIKMYLHLYWYMLKSLFVKEKEQPVYEFVYEVEKEKENGKIE